MEPSWEEENSWKDDRIDRFMVIVTDREQLRILGWSHTAMLVGKGTGTVTSSVPDPMRITILSS
jgi:hypothetical protein